MALIILGYVSVTVVYPFLKNAVDFRKIAKKVGGPKPHWFWGDLKKYGFNKQGLENNIKRCLDFPAMCTFYLGIKPTFHLYHPDVNKTILTCTLSKSWGYKKIFSIVLGDGLITSDGGSWKRQRRLLTTIFHFDILKEHCMVFNKNVKDTWKIFDEFAGSGRSYDVVPSLYTLAYVNMMESVMSQSAIDEDGRANIFIPALKAINQLLLERSQNLFHWNEAIYKLSQKGKQLFREKEKILKESIRIIKERKALLDSMKDAGDKNGINVIKDSNGKDEDGVGLSNSEIADEVITFFLAGMETTATTMTWMIYLLSTHPEYQDRCRNELTTVLGGKEDIEMSDLNKLPYLNQCTKEALRIFPPVHAVGRALEEDTVFSHRFNDYEKVVLKKGTSVVVNIFATHRNPNVWENPEVYDPERFNEKNISKIPNFAFIPFAAGPRNCIGQHLGSAEVKVSIAQLLRRYQFFWDPKTSHPKMKVDITLQPDGPIQLIIKRI